MFRRSIALTLSTILLLSIPCFTSIGSAPAHEGVVQGDSQVPTDGGRYREDEPVSFSDVSVEANLAGVNSNHFAWGDFNNDGYQDLLLGSRLWRNNGPPGWNFTDVTGSLGIGGGGNGVWGDYDNDGDLDFYTSGNRLWRNNGAPDYNFTDVTVPAGNLTDPYPTTAAGWGDYDRDGDIDLYVVNGEDYNGGDTIFYPDIFYVNNGDGTFTDGTVNAGLDTSGKLAYGRSVNWGDYNNDGWLDIHVGNYRLCPNYLWRNNHDGTFTDVAEVTGVTGVYDPDMYYDATAQDTYGDGTWGPTYGHTIGSAWGDLDNDGDLDLWDSNLVHKYVGSTSWPSMPYDIRGYVCDDSKIYGNNGPTSWNFTDVRAASGIPFKPIGDQVVYQGDELWSGVAMGDYDNDGDLDVYVPQIYDLNYAYSYLFRNNGDGTFTDMAQSLNLRVYNTYGGCWCDYDNDGDLDLVSGGGKWNGGAGEVQEYKVRLYRNGGNSNNWLHVKLVGTDNNHQGIGARVKIVSGGTCQIRELEGGMGSHGHQNSIPVEFGLGAANAVDEIEITWPDGKTQVVEGPGINRLVTITEDDNAPSITSAVASSHEVEEGEAITFQGAASDPDGSISVYQWDFDGDGEYDWDSPTSATAVHEYTRAGTYCARLRVWDDTGVLGDSESTDFITVTNVIPLAVLDGDTEGLEDEEMHFRANGTLDSEHDLASMKYFVDFDDGHDTGWVNHTDFNHSYPDAGTYTVTLMVRDDDGEQSMDTLVVSVRNLPPEPMITAPSNATEDEEVTIRGTCYDTVSDLDHILYRWDFGDDEETSFGEENTTSHVYTDKGTYDITLRVKDRHGTVNSTVHTIEVANVPPRCTSASHMVGKEDSILTFVGEGADTESDEHALTFQWAFGDGISSPMLPSPDVEHVYTQAGNFTAVLKVTDDDEDTGEWITNVTVVNVKPDVSLGVPNGDIFEDDEVTFTAFGSDTDSDEDDLLYMMDFGDGNVTEWQETTEFTHIYNYSGSYEVCLTVRDNSNATGSSLGTLSVQNIMPIAGFSHSPRSNVDKTTVVVFEAIGSTDTPSDMAGLNYTWSLGTEKEMFGRTVRYTFLSSGKHTVELSLTDDDGFTSAARATIRVENTPPEAVINASGSRVASGETVIFDAGDSVDTPGDLPNLEYRWSIDGKTLEGEIVEYAFPEAGTFTVTLTVTDEDGDSDEATLRMVIEEDGGGGKGTDEAGGTVIWISVSAFVILLLVGVIIVIIVLRSRKRKKEEGEPSDDLRYSYPETDAIQGRSPGICADDLRETIDEGEGSEQALYEEDLCGHPAGVRGTTQEFNGGTSPEVTTGDICSLPPLSAETLLPPVAGEVTSVDDMVALPPSTLEEVDKGSNPSDVISAAKPPSGNTPRRKVVRKVVKKKTA